MGSALVEVATTDLVEIATDLTQLSGRPDRLADITQDQHDQLLDAVGLLVGAVVAVTGEQGVVTVLEAAKAGLKALDAHLAAGGIRPERHRVVERAAAEVAELMRETSS